MKKIGLIMAVLLLILSMPGFAQEWSAAQKEVWNAELKSFADLQRGDIEGIVSFIHPDYRGLGHGATLPIDRATFRRLGEASLKDNTLVSCSGQPLSIQILGNTAIVHYIFTSTGKSSDGKMTSGQIAWMDVLVKQGDKWLCIADNGSGITTIPISTGSPEATLLYKQALDKFENGELTKARALVDQALERDPDFFLALDMAVRSGEPPDLARKHQAKIESLRGKVTEGERDFAALQNSMATGARSAGKEPLDRLLQFYPRDKHVQHWAAVYGFAEPEKAISFSEAAIKIDPTYAVAYNDLGYAHMAKGNMENAEKALKTYIELLPSAPNPHDSYAEFLRVSGRYDESIDQYQKSLALDPSFAASVSGIGDCYLKKGDTKKALEQYKLATEKAQDQGAKYQSLQKLAVAHVMGGNIPDALAALDESKAIALKQNWNDIAVSMVVLQGYMLSALGEYAQGEKKLQEAMGLTKSLKLSDESLKARNASVYQRLAYNALEAKNLKKAKEHIAAFQKATEPSKEPGVALKSLQAYLDLSEGRLDDAIAKFSSIPESPVSLHAMAVAYAQKGDKEKSQAALDKLNKWTTIDMTWAIQARQAAVHQGI